MARSSVGIIGTGNVGIAAAYAIFQRQLASEIVLVDKNRQRAEGEAMDLMHGQPLVGRVTVRAADYDALAGCQVIVITAGVNQKPGESRLDLLNRNAAVFREVAAELDRHAPDAVLVIATNPVDILTQVMQQLSRRPTRRVIGTGTMLDTSRFRSLLGDWYQVNPRSVHAYILGEHGDSEVPIWSGAMIGGLSVMQHVINGQRFDPEAMETLFQRVRTAAFDIISRKGYTNTAIGLVIAYLVRVILEDQRSVLPVSVNPEGDYGQRDVCFSVPCVIGAHGVEYRLAPEVDSAERRGLEASAGVLRDSLRQMTIAD
ncbi:L-lactate dehydrogenase [Thioalkalivibrio nitratireducens DSM 14787]|uniref:L-lactate dehydrogenase n=1 Tax=Thioalkalivibrio nitratireducens (strain DSM 14787 / UNIQEM 213 / ALEN2) TaxID=1255043 RepID=L0DXZ6_THIND|nr:L-lactate dehydrogenase [Thioalkalivibrio nitratireducens]AGA33898.1 L-lactate dehydrogenase [Thioalkalivibrio nitratireducens DSM 14787]